jgi:hypothetical protein
MQDGVIFYGRRSAPTIDEDPRELRSRIVLGIYEMCSLEERLFGGATRGAELSAAVIAGVDGESEGNQFCSTTGPPGAGRDESPAVTCG